MRKIFFILMGLVLFSLPFIVSDDPGTCSCMPSNENGVPFCVAKQLIRNSTEGFCEVSGYNGCNVGYRPECGRQESAYDFCDWLGEGAVDYCEGCNCVPTDDYPVGSTCYDYLEYVGREGACVDISPFPFPAASIGSVNLTPEMGFGAGWTSRDVELYANLYCSWEFSQWSVPAYCIVCPVGMKWDNQTDSCVCSSLDSCNVGATSCPSDFQETRCVQTYGQCTANITSTCVDGDYCGSTGRCQDCPTSSDGQCLSQACYGVDPDCGCINDNDVCGVDCSYYNDNDCPTPLSVTCAPVMCDGEVSDASDSCSDIDPDAVCRSNDGFCCNTACTGGLVDNDCNLAQNYDYSSSGLMTSKEGTGKATYSYNPLDRLVKATTNGQVEEYYYDAGGKRVKKVSSEQTVYYLYQGNDVLYTEETLPSCLCENIADPDASKSDSSADIDAIVNVALRGGTPIHDLTCPIARTDVNCDGVTNVQDVVHMVNIVHKGGNKATISCTEEELCGLVSPVAVSIPPLPNGGLITGDMNITVTLNESRSDIYLKYYIDGNYVGEDLSSPWKYSRTGNSLSSYTGTGTHTFKAEALTRLGERYLGEASVDFSVNIIPKTLAVTLSKPNGETVNGDLVMEATLNDSRAMIYVNFTIDGVKQYRDDSPSGSNLWSYTLSYETLLTDYDLNSPHTVIARVYDSNNNLLATSGSRAFTVGGANLILNPSFESVSGSNILNWDFDLSGNEAIYLVSTAGVCHYGSGKCITSPNNNWHPQRNIPLVNDSRYLLKYWVKRGNANVGSAHISLEDTASPWDHILSYCTHSFASSDWEKQVCTFDTQKQIVEPFSLYLHQPGSASNTPAYYDDVQLIRLGASSGTFSVPQEPSSPTSVTPENQPVQTETAPDVTQPPLLESEPEVVAPTLDSTRKPVRQITAEVVESSVSDDKGFLDSIFGFLGSLFRGRISGNAIHNLTTQSPTNITISQVAATNSDGTKNISINLVSSLKTIGFQIDLRANDIIFTRVTSPIPTSTMSFYYQSLVGGHVRIGAYSPNGNTYVNSGNVPIVMIKTNSGSIIYKHNVLVSSVILVDNQTLASYSPVIVVKNLPELRSGTVKKGPGDVVWGSTPNLT
jgi:YD repeat-containing protein